MNKFVLLLILSLTINISYCDDFIPLDIDSVYKYIVYLLKGLSNTKECECSIIFEKNKDEIISIAKGFFEGYNNGVNMDELVYKYGMELVAIEDLLNKCSILDISDVPFLLKSQEGIKNIGQKIFDKAVEIGELLKKAKESKNMEDKFFITGKIISLIFDFYVE